MRRRDFLESAGALTLLGSSSRSALALSGPSLMPSQQLALTNQRSPIPGVAVLRGGYINTANSTPSSTARPNWKGRKRYGFGAVPPPYLTWVYNQFRINAIAATPESLYVVQPVDVIKAAAVCYDSSGNVLGNIAPVTYRGNRSFRVPAAAIEWMPDPQPPSAFGLAAFPAGGFVDYRVVQTCPLVGGSTASAGQTWETSQTWVLADGWTDDIDATGVMVAGSSNLQGAFMSFPSYAIAVMPPGFKSLLICGDSIAFRQDDITGQGFQFGGGGLQKRAANAAQLPWTCMAIGGRTYSMQVNSAYCASIYHRFTVADLQLGSNDIANGSDIPTIDAAISAIIGKMRSAGIRWIGAHTITPRNNENNDHSNTINLWMATNQAVMTPYWTQATVAKGFPADGWGFGPGETRDTLNSVNLPAKVANGQLSALFDFSSYCQDPTTTWKWAVSSYAATLSAALSANAQTCSVNVAPAQFANMVFEPGVTNVDNPAAQGSPWAMSQAGAGPFTISFVVIDPYTGPANFGGLPAKSHVIGSAVRETYSPDSTHPSAKPILAALPDKTTQYNAIPWGQEIIPKLPGGVGNNIYGMSYDGKTFVGFGNTGSFQPLFTFTDAGGFNILPMLPGGTFAGIGGVNRDASVIVGYAGYSPTDFYQHAAVWSGGTVIDLTPGLSQPAYSQASACSAVGDIVAGFRTQDGTIYEAFTWTKVGNLVVLPGDGYAGAYGMSEDGTVIVGFDGATWNAYGACYWLNGTRHNIGTLPGDTSAYAVGCSSDGSVIVGVSIGSTNRGFRWTAAGGMVDIGAIAGGRSNVQPRNCSGDGSAIIGVAALTDYSSPVSFIWMAAGTTILAGPRADGICISKDGTIAGGDNYAQGVIWRKF